jgi:hypothetical protein
MIAPDPKEDFVGVVDSIGGPSLPRGEGAGAHFGFAIQDANHTVFYARLAMEGSAALVATVTAALVAKQTLKIWEAEPGTHFVGRVQIG